MDAIKGKYFSITDPQGVNTVIYKVNQTEKEISENAPKFTVERLDVAEELRGASDELGEITGKISSDDLLGKIFSGFCIGK